jgi:hypothetical protein
MFDLKISYYNLNQLLMRYLEFNKVELMNTFLNTAKIFLIYACGIMKKKEAAITCLPQSHKN